MLQGLSVKDILLIDEVAIEFADGLCVITGETGSGKSILLDCLGLALGERSENGLVRNGAKQGTVTAVFDIRSNKECKIALDKFGIESCDELILRRVVMPDGKSRAFINDTPSGVGTLKQVAATLVEIHGQHDQQSLTSQANHQKLLDEFGELARQQTEVSKFYSIFRDARNELQNASDLANKSKVEEDYIRFVCSELQKLAIKPGEETELAERRSGMQALQKSAEGLKQALSELKERDVVSAISSSQKSLLRLLQKTPDSNIHSVLEHLERAFADVAEAEAELESMLADSESGEAGLEALEDRLFAIRAASRKYNMPADELPVLAEKMKQQLSIIDNSDEKIAELKKKVETSRSDYLKVASELSKMRRNTAEKLEKTVMKELAPLKMEKTLFRIEVRDRSEENWNETGVDEVAFLASTNPGQSPQPIAKIASGGELSRFMLALKVALAGVKSVPSIIFDEIDTGISGAVADAVGQRLEKLGKALQVIVVTHQPQVAARGNHHLLISKKSGKEIAITNVEKLSEKERREEIARMLAGVKVTEEARAAAAKLLEMRA